MYVKPYAREGAPPTAASALGGPWREPSAYFFVLFALLGHFGTLFRVILDALVEVFSFLLSILRFSWFFLLFGPLRDPPGHQKTMKIIVLSSKIKVSLISKKCALGTAFGALGAHFGYHFGRFWGPWGSLWRPLGPQSAPKVEKRAKKWGPESPSAPRGAKRTPKAPQDLQNGPQKLEKK